MKYTELFESPIFGISKKAYDSLSYEAQDAIDLWQSVNWTGGPLERAFRKMTPLAQEIWNKSQPLRDELAKQGSTIRLYRGLVNNPNFNHKDNDDRILESWTNDIRIAEVFANQRRFNRDLKHPTSLDTPITDDEIKQVVNRYNKSGFASFRGRKYKKYDDTYFYIYDRHNSMITDGDDLEELLKRDQQDIEEFNLEIRQRGTVLEEDININRIIWVTNYLNSKEFIVKRK